MKNTALTDTSLPAATLFNRNVDNRKFLGKPIEEIKETFDDDKDNGSISFKFNGGGDPVGVNGVAADGEGTPVVYDLYGRRLEDVTCPGIYIVGGRPTIVR